jgi:hypothetical protein
MRLSHQIRFVRVRPDNLTLYEQSLGRDVNMTGKEWEGEFDPMADPEEQRHILSVLDSFR